MTQHRLLSPPHPGGVLARAGRVLTGVLALVALLALLAGVPYGLTRWVGWPLPHHWPTGSSIKAALTGPFTDHLLINTLACVCWLIWALFLADTARALPTALRDARLHANRNPPGRRPAGPPSRERRADPLRGLATILLASILAGLLSIRPHPSHVTTAASVPLPDVRPPSVTTALSTEAHGTAHTYGADTAVVQAPRDGIHDSLWRIAQRCLGDGNQWPDIYRLNIGLPQPDGGQLDNPNMIRPGWILRLPTTAAEQATRGAQHHKVPSTTTPAPSASTPSTPVHSAPTIAPSRPDAAPPHTPTPGSTGTPASNSEESTGAPVSAVPEHDTGHRAERSSGVDLGDGLYVSLGLAAAVSGALVTLRRHRRRWYTPGSGRRDDLPVAPVVRSLHLAHLRATTPTDHTDPDDVDDHRTDDEPEANTDIETDAGPGTVTPAGHRPTARHGAGAIDGRRPAVDVAHARGVGLVGPGAGDAARAMLLDLLTTAPNFGNRPDDRAGGGSASAGQPVEVLVPAADLGHLTGLHCLGERLPARLHVVADLSTALDQLESAILTRARTVDQQSAACPPTVVLFAGVPGEVARLQAVLDNGASLGIAGVLLGQWRAGTSIYVQADGVVSAAHGPAAPPPGTRLFAVPETAASTLLRLLHDAGRSRTDTRHAPAKTDPLGLPEASVLKQSINEKPSTLLVPENAAPVGANVPTGLRITADLAGAASRVVSGTAETPLTLRVLGPVSLTWTGHGAPADDVDAMGDVAQSATELAGALSPRVRELLVALAVHPDGITRDRLADTLWPDAPVGRPFNSLNTTLGRLRTALTRATSGQITDVVVTVSDLHRLDPAHLNVDYHEFAAAASARQRAATDTERAQAWRQMLAAYQGELAEGVNAEWLETPREAIRRDAIDAATGLARLVVRDDPRHALDLLEAARARDPYNEPLYGDIMRVQRRLGQTDAISRTLNLLATRLAELGETPDAQTVTLAESLQHAAGRPASGAQPVESIGCS